MLVKLQCPSCGAPLEVDSTREVFFCKYCGMKLVNIKDERTVNINKNVNVSGIVVHQRDTSQDPNLIIEYSTAHPQYPLTVAINKRDLWVLNPGQNRFYRLPAGKYTVTFTIYKAKWTRDIYIPFDNTPVRARIVYAKTINTYIEQPPQGPYDYQWIVNQQRAAEQAQREAKQRMRQQQKAAKRAKKMTR